MPGQSTTTLIAGDPYRMFYGWSCAGGVGGKANGEAMADVAALFRIRRHVRPTLFGQLGRRREVPADDVGAFG